MWPVLEVVAAPGGTCRSPEVVEGDGRIAAFGEPKGELLVEAVEPANVGKDDDADARRLLGAAAKAANAFPSAAWRVSSSCETAAPRMTGIGGDESSSKHISASLKDAGRPKLRVGVAALRRRGVGA
jgi:hypothetical protein